MLETFGGCPTGPTPPFTSRRPSLSGGGGGYRGGAAPGVGTVDVFLATAAGLPRQRAAGTGGGPSGGTPRNRRGMFRVKAPEVRTVDVSVQVAARPGRTLTPSGRRWSPPYGAGLTGGSWGRGPAAQLGALIFGVEGVENYALTAPAADVAAAVDELPQLGTLDGSSTGGDGMSYGAYLRELPGPAYLWVGGHRQWR